ncbi:MAG: hypothetical protein FWF98_02060 [Dehalococcoidia bacterium]|nr:hypothetical protein [Dehalococcoidia bacterium]
MNKDTYICIKDGIYFDVYINDILYGEVEGEEIVEGLEEIANSFIIEFTNSRNIREVFCIKRKEFEKNKSKFLKRKNVKSLKEPD